MVTTPIAALMERAQNTVWRTSWQADIVRDLIAALTAERTAREAAEADVRELQIANEGLSTTARAMLDEHSALFVKLGAEVEQERTARQQAEQDALHWKEHYEGLTKLATMNSERLETTLTALRAQLDALRGELEASVGDSIREWASYETSLREFSAIRVSDAEVIRDVAPSLAAWITKALRQRLASLTTAQEQPK